MAGTQLLLQLEKQAEKFAPCPEHLLLQRLSHEFWAKTGEQDKINSANADKNILIFLSFGNNFVTLYNTNSCSVYVIYFTDMYERWMGGFINDTSRQHPAEGKAGDKPIPHSRKL